MTGLAAGVFGSRVLPLRCVSVRADGGGPREYAFLPVSSSEIPIGRSDIASAKKGCAITDGLSEGVLGGVLVSPSGGGAVSPLMGSCGNTGAITADLVGGISGEFPSWTGAPGSPTPAEGAVPTLIFTPPPVDSIERSGPIVAGVSGYFFSRIWALGLSILAEGSTPVYEFAFPFVDFFGRGVTESAGSGYPSERAGATTAGLSGGLGLSVWVLGLLMLAKGCASILILTPPPVDSVERSRAITAGSLRVRFSRVRVLSLSVLARGGASSFVGTVERSGVASPKTGWVIMEDLVEGFCSAVRALGLPKLS